MSTGSELYDLLAKTNATLNPNNTITLRFNDGSSYTTGVIKDGPELSPADKAMEEAKEASVISQAAMGEANKAAIAAGNAEQSASEAAASATNAENFASEAQQSASTASTAATNAETSAGNAATSASNAATNAQAAATSASAAEGSAQTAATEASEAKTQATAATSYANGALTSLSTVQDVIGVLDWAQKNAQYTLTGDTDIVPGKTYWIRSGSGTEADPYTYTPVVNPVKTSLSSYYEISSVDEAMADYINTHLALTDEGLWVLSDTNGWRLLVAGDGVSIIDSQGKTVAQYRSTITLGANDGNQMRLTPDAIAFVIAGQTIAYIAQDKLMTTNAELSGALFVGDYYVRQKSNGKLAVGLRR